MKKITPADSTLIRKIKKNGCNESYKLLAARHEKLFYKICQKYIPAAYSKGIEKREIFNDKDFVIFKAITSFKNGRKTKFSTWLGNCTKYYCLGLINSNNRYINSEEELLQVILDSQSRQIHEEETKYKFDKEYIFNILDNLKDKRISRVFKLRFFDESKKSKKPTWSFIAKEINTSTQTAINLYNRGKEMLHKKITSNQSQDMI